MQRAFRERFRVALENGTYNHSFDFDDDFRVLLKRCEDEERERVTQKKVMRTFEQSSELRVCIMFVCLFVCLVVCLIFCFYCFICIC